jgi:hypothetical protein
MVYYPRFPQNTIKVYDTAVVENLEDSRKPVTKQEKIEVEYARANLPSAYQPSAFDRGPFMRDATWMQFVNWRRCGEEDQSVEYVKARESSGMLIPTVGRPMEGKKGGLIMYDSIFEVNMRDVGKWLHYCHNVKQEFMDFIRSEEGKALVEYFENQGYRLEGIDGIAVAVEPKKAIYSVYKNSDGKVILRANKDADKMLDLEERAFGMKEGERKEAVHAEEIRHMLGGLRFFYTRHQILKEEIETKQDILEHYRGLAKSAKRSGLAAKYERIARSIEHDLATIDRYLESYKGLSEIVESLEAEAKENGLEGEDVMAYVASKLSQEAEGIEGSSGKEASGEANAEACDGAAAEGDGDLGGDCGDSGGE